MSWFRKLVKAFRLVSWAMEKAEELMRKRDEASVIMSELSKLKDIADQLRPVMEEAKSNPKVLSKPEAVNAILSFYKTSVDVYNRSYNLAKQVWDIFTEFKQRVGL